MSEIIEFPSNKDPLSEDEKFEILKWIQAMVLDGQSLQSVLTYFKEHVARSSQDYDRCADYITFAHNYYSNPAGLTKDQKRQIEETIAKNRKDTL